jgi:hypothetical protein
MIGLKYGFLDYLGILEVWLDPRTRESGKCGVVSANL